MIGEHLSAFLWLRWRLMVNRWRRGGALNAALMVIVVVGSIALAVPLLLGSFALGLYTFPQCKPDVFMYIYDGLIGFFLLFWCIGLLAELQRTEPLSLAKFMHLPVSPTGAFLINYVSSLFRLSLLVFVPVMVGFALALAPTQGWRLLIALPLVAAFLLMVTALTYQFQGWLAVLMSNPRKRRSIVMIATMAIILIAQLPNLFNYLVSGNARRGTEQSAAHASEMDRLKFAIEAQELDATEGNRQMKAAREAFDRANQEAEREQSQRLERGVRLANTIVPVGWLPLGIMSAAEGSLLPALLGLAGMMAIAAVSLRQAYRTTVGLYQGQPTRSGMPVAPRVAPEAAQLEKRPGLGPRPLLVEARLPRLSEPVSAIALAGFRSFLRAPEAKMMLLSPFFSAIIFGTMLWRSRQGVAEPVRPLIGLAAMGLVLLGMLHLMGNQFGFDRDGFRVFVLSSARRRDILLGKNLAFAPFIFGLAAIQLAVVQVICPMRLGHLLAMPPIYLTMFLCFCMYADLTSVVAPLYIAPGTMKVANAKLTTGLLQFVLFFTLFPLSQLPALLPLGIEVGFRFNGWDHGLPIALFAALCEFIVVFLLYRLAIAGLGALLQDREKKVLETVTKRES